MLKFLFGDSAKRPGNKQRDLDDPRRRFKRKIVHSNPPKGELISPTHGRLSYITLWDVSQGGVCVVAGAKLKHLESEDELLTLSLRASHGASKIDVTVKRMWEKEESGSTYYGLQYKGPGLPTNTFLDQYIPNG